MEATDTWVKALQAYNSSINSKTCSAEDLAGVLLKGFYFVLKRHIGELSRGFNIYSDKILNVALKSNQRNKNVAAVTACQSGLCERRKLDKDNGTFSDV